MKRIVCLTTILLLFAMCQPMPRKYYLILATKSDNGIIADMPPFEYDTIRKADDNDAYVNALERFYVVKITDVRLSLPSFPITGRCRKGCELN